MPPENDYKLRQALFNILAKQKAKFKQNVLPKYIVQYIYTSSHFAAEY